MIRRTECPVCNKSAEVIFARPYSLPELQSMVSASGLGTRLTNQLYEIRRCSPCKLHFQTVVMSDDELENWYSPDRDDNSFLREIEKQKLHWFAHQTEEILVLRQVSKAPMPKVLDFGCNWGKWSSMALAHGCDVYGIDVNRDASRFCRSRGVRMITLEEAQNEKFDFINVDQVMEHLSTPREIATRLSACLRPGGLMKFSTPHNEELPRILAQLQSSDSSQTIVPTAEAIDALFPLMHVNLFTPSALRALASTVGLSEFRQPLLTWLGAGQLWNIPRQLNRNLLTPFKRWLGKGTYLWFEKPGT